jgi:hypothetical protein
VNKIVSSRAYFTVNIILGGVILLIMGYSAVYSPEKDSYPVVCIHEKITGQQCPSCGISHAFSLIVRGRFREAEQWNPYAMRVFLFFFVQLLMRTGLAIWLFRKERETRIVGFTDAVISALMAAATFFPFLSAQWSMIMK